MAQSRRGKKGGNIKQVFRNHMRRNKGYLPVFYGNIGMDSSSVARSLRTFMQGGLRKPSKYGGYIPRKGTRRRQIYDEWKKVRKRMDELIAEGYDFDTDEFREIYSGWTNLKNSKKQLERLKELKKTKLRWEATSYMGITDKVKMKKRWKYRHLEWVDGEVVFPEVETPDTGLTIPEVEMPGQEVRTPDELPGAPLGLPAPLDQIPYDLDIKIVNLLDDEEAYIQACDEFRATHGRGMSKRQLEKYYRAITLAQECITMLMNASPEEKAAVVQFIEDHGELGSMIEQDFIRLFYEIPDYYNLPLLEVLPLTQEAADAMNDLKEDEEGFVDYSDLKPSSWDLDF